MMRNAVLLSALSFVLFFPGCSSYNVKEFVAAENIKIDPVKADMACDYFFLRLDVIRQFTTTTTTRWVTTTDAKGMSHSQMVTETTTTPVAYHYLGTDLGNGFFIDLNNNLSIDLIRLLNIPENKNFKLTNKKHRGIFEAEVVMQRIDGKAVISIGGLLGTKSEIVLSKDKATIQGGLLSSNQDIVYDKNSITYDSHGFVKDWGITSVEKTGTGTKSAYNNYIVSCFGKEGFVKLPLAMTVVKDGETLRIINNDRPVYAFVHNRNGYFLYDNEYRGARIEILPSQLKITTAAGTIVYELTYL